MSLLHDELRIYFLKHILTRDLHFVANSFGFRVLQIALRNGGRGRMGEKSCWGGFCDRNLRRSDFDHSNLLQS